MTILLGMLLAAAVEAGTPPKASVRREGDVVFFQGQINRSSVAAATALIGDRRQGKVRRLVITSRGGESDPGLDFAELIASQDLEVEVREHCLSSCASFALVAAKRRIVAEGAVVGFHKTSSSFERVARSLQLTDVAGYVAARARRERALYARKGVSERLLYEPEVAIAPICFAAAPKTDGPTPRREGLMASRFSFWVPTSAHLKSLGMEVEGDWPATPEDLGARVQRQRDQLSSRVTFTGSWDEAALAKAYAKVRLCPDAVARGLRDTRDAERKPEGS